MNLKKVKGTQLFIIFGFVMLIAWLIGLLIDPERQFKLFFSSCQNFLADFTNTMDYVKDRDPFNCPTNGPSEHGYLPLSYVLVYLFTIPFKNKIAFNVEMWKDPRVALLIFLFFTAVTISVFVQLYGMCKSKESNKAFLAFLLVFSGVYLFALERGNLIVLSLSLTIYFLNHYNDNVKWKKELSFIFLAMAASLKIFPAVLGLLVIIDGKWKDAFRLVIYGVLFAFIPFLFFKGGFSNIPVLLENAKVHNEVYKYDLGCNYVSLVRGYFENKNAKSIILVSSVASYLVPLVILFAVPFFKNNWEKIAAISLVMLVIPPHSGKYNAIFILPVIVLFLNEAKVNLINVGLFLAFLMIEKQVQLSYYDCVYLNILVFFAMEAAFFVKAILAIKPRQILPTYKAVGRRFFKKEPQKQN